jgi:hypothetical protein
VTITVGVFLLLIFPFLNLRQGPPETESRMLSTSSSENKIEVLVQVGIYDIDPSNMSAEAHVHLNVIFPYKRSNENLLVLMPGGPSITCSLALQTENSTNYSGDSDITQWLISGTPELYPFESYSIDFPVVPLISKYEENFGFIFSTSSLATFTGDKTRTLVTKFTTNGNSYGSLQVTLENYAMATASPEGSSTENYPMLVVHTARRENFGILILSPVFLAYALLASSFMLKVPETRKRSRASRENLRNRLTIYLALFAFSVGFFFYISPLSPIELSIAELIVLNLSICVSLSGVFSIFSDAVQKNLNALALIACIISTTLVLILQLPPGLSPLVFELLFLPEIFFSVFLCYEVVIKINLWSR